MIGVYFRFVRSMSRLLNLRGVMLLINSLLIRAGCRRIWDYLRCDAVLLIRRLILIVRRISIVGARILSLILLSLRSVMVTRLLVIWRCLMTRLMIRFDAL